MRDVEMFRMKKMQAYIAIRGSANASETSDVASELLALYAKRLLDPCRIIVSTRPAAWCCAGRLGAWPKGQT